VIYRVVYHGVWTLPALTHLVKKSAMQYSS